MPGYLANRGLGKQFRVRVVEELHKRGIEASVARLTLDPFRGLVAQDLRIYDFRNRETPLALVSEVSLDINYAALPASSAVLERDRRAQCQPHLSKSVRRSEST